MQGDGTVFGRIQAYVLFVGAFVGLYLTAG